MFFGRRMMNSIRTTTLDKQDLKTLSKILFLPKTFILFSFISFKTFDDRDG
jgi:hypothetical protein